VKTRQGGIALISVLLIMSLALLITGGLLRSHRLSLQGSAQQLQQLHLRQLAAGAETRALLLLQDRLQAPEKTVDRTQPWAHISPEPDLEGGQVRIVIEDLAGRFNLNALLRSGQIDQVTLNRWARLLELLALPPLSLDPVGPLREFSQLRLLPGVDAHLLRQLEPWVSVLPADTPLNINTAPALVLRTLGDVDASAAEALVGQGAAAPWANAQAFTQNPLLASSQVSSHGLGIHSRWFRISVQVTRDGRGLQLATDVEVDSDEKRLNVLQRRFLPLNAHERPR
jgi:general secretion pathway protein K